MRQLRKIRVELQGSPSTHECDSTPWDDGLSPPSFLRIPQFVEWRIRTSMDVMLESNKSPGERHFRKPADDIFSQGADRLTLWGVINLAQQNAVSEDNLFKSSRRGESFVLRPTPRSAVPLQWVHIGPGAIPDSLADTPCAALGIVGLLNNLNSVLGTDYRQDMPGLSELLKHIMRDAHDFGQAYGTLRPWWLKTYGTLSEVVKHMKNREDELTKLRRNALRGSCITDPRLPPRRVWDLFSNRVLLFSTLPQLDNTRLSSYVPRDVWCLSHSWVDDEDRVQVVTKINGEVWPVPLPRATTLAHIRVELLNMGAQYVWLDVLCLRQVDNRPGTLQARNERLRAQEWTTDIPTIGYIYQRDRFRVAGPVPCITYFNGLGLPFTTSPAVLNSSKHWCHRVWTVQEACESWLPGGLTGNLLDGMPEFFAEVRCIVAETVGVRQAIRLIKDPKARRCAAERDRVSGLGHLLDCKTLPLYSEGVPATIAWTLMLKHLPAWLRTDIFVQYAVDTPFGLWVSWDQFLVHSPKFPMSDEEVWTETYKDAIDELTLIRLVDEDLLYMDEPGRYWHQGYAIGPCRALQTARNGVHDEIPPENIRFQYFPKHGSPVSIVFASMQGVLVPGVDYTLLGFYSKWFEQWRKWWVVLEEVGQHNADGERAIEGLKWGVLYMEKDEAERIAPLRIGRRGTRVVYVTGNDALNRGRYVNEYLRIFNRQ